MKRGSTTAPAPMIPAHIAHYEELRRQAVERQVRAVRLGLAVLLRQGLAAWVEQWSKDPRPAPVRWGETARTCPLPDDTSVEVVHVLAAMALGHLQEVPA